MKSWLKHMPHAYTQSNPSRWWLAAAAAMAVLAAGNALLFSSRAATPLVQADAWYFLESFVKKYLDGTLQPLDFFIQRGSGDHAQPLQKLVLLWHTRYFGMDFRIEGLAGTTAGIIFCILLTIPLLRSGRPSFMQSVAIGLVFVVALSLNATDIYTWPLVTLGFILLSLATAFVLLLSTKKIGSKPLVVFVLSFFLGLVSDEQGVIFAIASIIAILLFHSAPRHALIKSSAATAAAIILSRVAHAWIANENGVSADAFSTEKSILAFMTWPEAMNAITIPLGDALLHRIHWEHFHPHEQLVRWGSIMFMLAFHAWTWIYLIRMYLQGRKDTRLVLATFLLLTSYAVLAGIILNRVSSFGWDYLHQPRYVFYYQLPTLAGLLLLHHRLDGKNPDISKLPTHVATGVAFIVLLCVQLHVTQKAWQLPPHLFAYWENAALKMDEIRLKPETVPDGCPNIIDPCHSRQYDEKRRAHILGILESHHLNLYSKSFQRRNKLEPKPRNETGN